jgi:hypothetical protein
MSVTYSLGFRAGGMRTTPGLDLALIVNDGPADVVEGDVKSKGHDVYALFSSTYWWVRSLVHTAASASPACSSISM